MKKPNSLLFAVAALLVTTPLLRATTIQDFEPTSGFLPGESVDGGTVTDLAPGGGTVIDGLQSLSLDGTYTPAFGSATIYDDTDFSIDINPTAGSYFDLYVGPNGVAGSTPMGITLNGATEEFSTFSAASSQTTGVYATPGDSYKLTIDADLIGGTFTAYATNLTTGAAPVDLGTYDSYDGTSDTPAVYEASSTAGEYIEAYSGPTVIDDLTVTDASAVPEPSSMALMLVGLAALGMFRWKKHMQAMLS